MRDAGGFDEFYRDTSARMVRYALAMTGDLGHASPEAWLRLVVNRLATDRWRRLGGRRAAMVRAGPPPAVPPPGEDTVVLVAALRRLPAHLRQAITLHYLFDMPVQQIAEETGAAVGTVTSWLHRGRAELAAALSSDRLMGATDAD